MSPLQQLVHVDLSWILARICSRRSPTDDEGFTFFCSNRHAQLGCGRTFPVYWHSIIPHCTLRVAQLLGLLKAVAAAPSLHAAWQASRLTLSLRSASRWLRQWAAQSTWIRTRLHMLIASPGKIDELPDPLMLRHLHAAFPLEPCSLAAFQSKFQIAIGG